jgi:hypothetical protein
MLLQNLTLSNKYQAHLEPLSRTYSYVRVYEIFFSLIFLFTLDLVCLILPILMTPLEVSGPLFLLAICRNPTLGKCEDETHIPKSGNLESSGIPATSELDSKGQNNSP